jgi:YVTN family beta-propeller protein
MAQMPRGPSTAKAALVVAVALAAATLGAPELDRSTGLSPSAWPLARAELGHRPPGSSTRAGGPRLEIVARADTGSQPKSVNVSPDGSRVVVCNFGYRDHDNVWVYNAQTLEHVGTINFRGNAVETAFSADGRTLYVSNFHGAKLMVVDFDTLTIRGEIRVGRDPKTIALSPDGSTIYVANYASGSVSVVDAAQLVETRRIRAGVQPRGMAVARDGRLFVAAFRDHETHVFDPTDYHEAATIPMCRFPRHLALSPDDSLLYVSCSSVRAVHWHDPVGGRRVGVAPVGENPRTIDMSDDGRYIAVADFDSSSVSLVDTVALTHRTNVINGADRIVGVAIHPGPNLRVYATSWNTSRVFALEPAN